jgi:tetratricopeptide (TPR) repeat protein
MPHDDPNAHDSLGMAYEQSGDYYAALSEFSQALALDPEFEPSIGHLADTYFQLGRYRDAVREYQRYIRVTGSDSARAMGYSNLVTIYRAAGDLVEAQGAAATEARLNPSAIWDGILVALDRGQDARVSALERPMLSGQLGKERGAQPNIRTQFYNRGYLAMRRGDQAGAIMNFQIALQHLPPTSGIDPHEDCLADAYLEFGMWREAIAEYTRLRKVNPNYPLVEYHLAEAYAHLNDTTQSRNAYTRFLHVWGSADPDRPEVKEARAKTSAV